VSLRRQTDRKWKAVKENNSGTNNDYAGGAARRGGGLRSEAGMAGTTKWTDRPAERGNAGT